MRKDAYQLSEEEFTEFSKKHPDVDRNSINELEIFPNSIGIIDLFHARQSLHRLDNTDTKNSIYRV